MDGWSTMADITTSFNAPIRADSIGAANIRIIKLNLDNATKAPKVPVGGTSPVLGVLVYGTDYTTSVSNDIDSDGKILKITPLKPLTPSTGGTNIGYMVVLTNGILDVDGRQAQPDDYYAGVKARANCDGLTGIDSYLCQVIKGQIQIASALPAPVGVPAANIVLTWSFTTQSVDDTFNAIAANVPAGTIRVVPIGKTTKDINPASPGLANVYTGSVQVPYYLTAAASPSDTSINTKFWTAASASPVPGVDPASRNLTRFNPMPAATSQQTIPLLVTVPNSTSCGGSTPGKKWPVVIVQHGITGQRTDALGIADSYASACIVVAAIDLPLHGLTPTTGGALYCSSTTANPACLGAKERTFDVDLLAPLGTIDSTGAHFINLSSPATGRDNWRQAEADHIMFEKSIRNLDLTGDSVSDIDTNQISFTGLSLGAIVGGSHVHFVPDFATVALSAPGGVITKLLLDSPTFSPRIVAGVTTYTPPATTALVKDSYAYNLFFRDYQAVIDSADPINHILDATKRHPTYLQKVVGDTVVPNNSTDRLIAAGGFRKVTSGAANAVAPGNPAYVAFPYGTHVSLLTYGFCPSTEPGKTLCTKTTIEMQKQAVMFAASAAVTGGPFLTVTDPTVVQQ
jgi:hypothetical protein